MFEATRLLKIANGEQVGTLDVHGDGVHLDLDYYVDDNGRGAKVAEVITLDRSTLTPERWTVSGTSLMGGAVDEAFERIDGQATWRSQADSDSAQSDACYVPVDGSPFLVAIAAQAAEHHGGEVAVLPQGCARVEDVELPSPLDGIARIQRITGLALADQFLLRTSAGEIAGIVSDRDVLVLPELAGAAEQIAASLQAATLERYQRVTRAATLHAAGTLLIRHARVLDIETGTISQPTSILVRDDHIVAVGEGAGEAADHLIDADGRMAVPGLHDMHAHLTASVAQLYIASGVTGVRDQGNDNAMLPALMDSIATGTLVGPTAVPAGFIEGRSPFSARFGRVVGSLDEALDAVDFYAQRGYHAIKIYNSFNPEWVAATTQRAHEHGMRAHGHIPAFMTADEAMAAGYDEVTHLNQLVLGWVLAPGEDTRTPLRLTALARLATLDLDSEPVQSTLRAMASEGKGLDVTIAIIERLMLSRAHTDSDAVAAIVDHLPSSWGRYRRRTYVPFHDAAELEAYDRSFEVLLDVVRRLHDLNVPLWPGTDDDIALTLHRELELFVAAGLTPLEALQRATIAAARHLGRDDVGRVAAGQLADFTLLDGDPTQDIGNLRRTALTVARGRAFDPAVIFRSFGIEPFAEPVTLESA